MSTEGSGGSEGGGDAGPGGSDTGDTGVADVGATAEVSTKAEEKKQEAVAQALKKYKLKVNGTEREYDERMIQVLAQKGLAADEKFQSSAAERKKAERLARLAKDDPDAFIREARGEEPIEFYKRKLADEIKRLSADPKELELETYKKELEALKAEKAERVKKESEAKMKEASDRMLTHYEDQITKGIKSSGLPANEQTIAYAAEIMLQGVEMGQEIPTDIVMEMVRERYVNEYQRLVGKLDGDDLINILGPETVKKLLKANGKKASTPVPAAIAKEEQAAADGDDYGVQKPKYVSKEDFEKRIRDWANS